MTAPDPRSAAELLDAAIVQRQAGHGDEAMALLERAVTIAPTFVPALVNLGQLHQGRGGLGKAKEFYARALEADPVCAPAHNNLAAVLVAEENDAAAIPSFFAAVRFDPDNATYRYNLAGALEREGRLLEALAQLDAIIAREPKHLTAILAKAPMLFALGRFDEAWRHYAHRHRLYWSAYPEERRPLPSPLWQGETLAGKKILLSYEQGLGDQIMYAALVPDILAQGARVIIECEERLIPLFVRSFPGVEVEAWRQPWNPAVKAPDIDTHAPLGNLGQWLMGDFSRVPRQHGYLKADPVQVQTLRARYEAQAKGRRIVGLSWHSAAQPFGPHKSMPLEALKPLLTDPRLFCVSLQYGAAAQDAALQARRMGGALLVDPSIEPSKDMDAAAAQIAAMDLVITVSNTTAHLAGALGKAVWVLLPKVKGRLWYWFPDRQPNPWYPSLRTFVQSRAETWDEPVADAVAALVEENRV